MHGLTYIPLIFISGRKRYKRQMAYILSIYVDVPAAIRLQRIYRGRIAKLILNQLKIEMKAILLLQKNFRIIVYRIWEKQLRYEQKRKLADSANNKS